MKQEPLTISQTFASPSELTRQYTIQQKVEHYLKSLLHSASKPA